jgi:hypothetical protein
MKAGQSRALSSARTGQETTMRDSTDRDYLLSRARREREIATTCEDNSAALVHFRMADEYERRAQMVYGKAGNDFI